MVDLTFYHDAVARGLPNPDQHIRADSFVSHIEADPDADVASEITIKDVLWYVLTIVIIGAVIGALLYSTAGEF